MRTFTRILPAAGLFLLAPLVAEFLLGNLPITMLRALVALAPMYGGGALLIRETARRAGRGWPTILLMAAAYGLVEEGLVTQSLSNPDYAGARLLDPGFVPALGIGVPWTLFVLTLHTVWSIATPIALVETWTGNESTPWLRLPGTIVTAALFVLGATASAVITLTNDPFVAPVPRLAAAATLAAALVVVAFRMPRRVPAPSGTATPPPPVLVFGATLLAGAAFMLGVGPGSGLPGLWRAAVWVVLAALVLTLLPRWSRADGWGRAHVFALAAGTTLTYAGFAFPQQPVIPTDPAIDLLGNAVFAAGTVMLLTASWLRIRRSGPYVDIPGRAAVGGTAPKR